MNTAGFNVIGLNASIKKVEEELNSPLPGGGWLPFRRKPRQKRLEVVEETTIPEEIIEKASGMPTQQAIDAIKDAILNETKFKMDDFVNDFATIRIDVFRLFVEEFRLKRLKEEEEEFLLLLLLLKHRKAL